jgi:hypothetical protein
MLIISLSLLSHHCTGIKDMSAAAWAEFGRALGAGALKSLKKLDIQCTIDLIDQSVNHISS